MLLTQPEALEMRHILAPFAVLEGLLWNTGTFTVCGRGLMSGFGT